MPVDPTLSKSAPMSCERCGGTLSLFDEQPDDNVILCSCRYTTEFGPVEGDRPPETPSGAGDEPPRLCHRCGNPVEIFREWEHGETFYLACECAISPASPDSVRESGAATGARRCGSCGATLVLVGTLPDGSPAEAQCPCQRVEHADPGRRPKSREAPVMIRRGEQRRPDAVAVRGTPAIPTKSGRRSLMLVVGGALVVAAVLAGFRARGNGDVKVSQAPVKTIPRSDVVPAPEGNPPPSMPPGGVEVRNDDSGSVTFVSGSDPSAVLRAFCRHPQFKSALVPGTLQSTTPPDPDLLLGSAVLMDGAGTPRQVILKRDPKTNRWSIGNGTAAIALGNDSAPAK